MAINIKVCGLTNYKEIKQIEKLNVDRIGFINIKRSKRYIDIEEINRIHKRINNRFLSTLVLEPNSSFEVIRKINDTKIFNIQLHSLNNFDVRYIKWSQYHDFNYVNTTKVIGLKDNLDKIKIREIYDNSLFADNILLDYIKDGKTGGTNTHIPIETAIEASKIIKKQNINTEVTLAGGLSYEYLEKIQDKLHYFDRIDLNSGVEDKPGYKNISEIKKIIKLVNEM